MHKFLLFLSFACLCMIAFCHGLCTLLSFEHAAVFLIPPWVILFIQSKELCFAAFFVVGFSLLGVLLSFYPPWFLPFIQSIELCFVVVFAI